MLTFLLLFAPFTVQAAHGQTVKTDKMEQEVKPDTLMQITQLYMQRLHSLASLRDSLSTIPSSLMPNAYYCQMLASPTLYSSPIVQMMSGADSSPYEADEQLRRVYAVNSALAMFYVRAPWLVAQTESDMRKQGSLREDISEKIQAQDRLSDKVQGGSLTPTTDDDIVVVTRRPNFWKVTGNTSMQFSQSHFSDNWAGGGENAYAGLAAITLNFNFNNQKKITWNNTLDARLGFTTKKSDKSRVFRPNTNSIRYTTNWGYQAVKNLYYSGQINLSTQLVPNFRENSDVVQSDFLSPGHHHLPRYAIQYSMGQEEEIYRPDQCLPLVLQHQVCGPRPAGHQLWRASRSQLLTQFRSQRYGQYLMASLQGCEVDPASVLVQ